MTKTIEQMAVEAGLGMETEAGFTSWPDMVPLKEWTELERFAALVRADALEEAAAICEARASKDTDWDTSAWNQAVQGAAFAIRAARDKP